MDPLSAAADEVALEGLDGITVPSLWIRLQARQPKFPLRFDDCTKELIWRSLASNTDLRFYQIPQERDDVVLFDRFKDIDPETGIQTAQKFCDTKKDVYPVHIVLESKDGIQGSCAVFKQRTDVTKDVRSKSLAALVNLEEVMERYGRKLVVVASQTLRFRTLIGSESDPDLKLNDDSYCLLERVGRARWQGELQSDLHGNYFKTDARKLHYIRKSVVKHGLITMQSHVSRVKSGQQQHSILLLLKRFHINRRSKYDILMEYVSNLLQELPGQFSTMVAVREQLNVTERTFKRVFQYMRAAKLVEFCKYPLEELDPSAKPCLTKKGNKVQVRCLRLLKPYTKKGVADDDDDDDEDDDSGARRRRAYPPEGRIMEKDVLSQAYHIVLSCGTKGTSKSDISYRMNVGNLESRMLCRRLERDGLIKGFMVDEGRQRTTKYISHTYSHTKRIYLSLVDESNGSIRLIQVTCRKKSKQSVETTRETYRLLRRKNLIVEAVHSFKVIEGLFPLQKMINDEEKLDGVRFKCCKKTILRLVHSLSREGLLKMFTTTVIQDDITKKVEMVVHPSIQPNDEIVHRLIEQVRFKISSSYSTLKRKPENKRNSPRRRASTTASSPLQVVFDCIYPRIQWLNLYKCTIDTFKIRFFCLLNFCHLFIVLSAVSVFAVRGLGKSLGFQPKMHRLRVVHTFLWYVIYGHPLKHNSTGSHPTSEPLANPHSSDPEAKHPDNHEKTDLKDTNKSTTAIGDSWKKFIPPVRVHKEFSSGWAMVGDVLLCLPLSIFMQVIQINYKVDGLEEYLNDPVKQHYLVGVLPARMRRQLLYRRKYMFSFHENLQKLVYMGLLQFGPVEKFKDKDQVFVFLRRNATIVDTTSAEPHYWLVTESPDKPFDKRKYTFNTAEDIESYWFDLMCVCLNTPLGTHTQTHTHTAEAQAQAQAEALAIVGSREVCDDGTIPGDSKGAGGLDSEFFAHLKRNWLWTNYLLVDKTVCKQNARQTREVYILDTCIICFFFVGIEPATRNQRVVGGKRQKRKRTKKEVVKVPCKKKKGARAAEHKNEKPKKRSAAHDEADHRALKMMTRQRVYWSLQEDSLMMLCSVATHMLNSKLKRPFVPYCVVRDMLHAEFEISMDKTSVAVGRRTRYILKNPQTLLNYRICLTEAYQDKALMKQLELRKPVDPNKPKDCAEAFSEYAKILRQKFSSVMSTGDMIMPDTKQELFQRIDDIHTIVLHNLIQSTLAMTNSQMKSSRSFQTFQMYSKYNQGLLCQVFIQCRKRGLINRRRVHQPFGPKKNRALPIMPMSYQLSQSYYRYNIEQTDDRPPGEEAPSEAAASNAAAPGASEEPPDVSDMLGFGMDSTGGACMASLSLMSLGLLNVFMSIPKRMVVVDSNLLDKDPLKCENVLFVSGLHHCGLCGTESVKQLATVLFRFLKLPFVLLPVKVRNLHCNDNIVVESCDMKLQLRSTPAHHIFTVEDSPPLDFNKCGPSLVPSILTSSVCFSSSSSSHCAEECDRRLTQERGYTPQDIEACAQLRRSLDEAGEKVSFLVSYFYVGCLISCSLFFTFLQQDLQEEGQVLKVGARGARYVLRQHAEPWLLTVNSKQWSQARDTPDPFSESRQPKPLTGKRCRREDQQEAEEVPAKRAALESGEGEDIEGRDTTREKLNEEARPENGKVAVDEGRGEKQLHTEEEAKGEQTRRDEEGEEKSGQEKMETEEKQVERRELRPRRGSKGSESVEEAGISDADENVSFISRPWRMVDGKLNRLVCKGMLESVLYHIMTRPGLTHQSLVEHYKDVLQPMAVLDLLQALLDMGCLTKKTLVKSPKPSLFSRPVCPTRSEMGEMLEEPDAVFYEPTISCCLRLSQVLPNERHWNYYLH
uniref:B-block binding subunit of TFIIIC domain-containing protein n=1 Tax=Scophthalmus maximus TaxID=52904 RepID=A0A8D3C325_SCOMX